VVALLEQPTEIWIRPMRSHRQRAPAPPVFLVARGFPDDRDLVFQDRPSRAWLAGPVTGRPAGLRTVLLPQRPNGRIFSQGDREIGRASKDFGGHDGAAPASFWTDPSKSDAMAGPHRRPISGLADLPISHLPVKIWEPWREAIE
jgi:hypothetical protein